MRLCGICEKKCKTEICSDCNEQMLKARKEIDIRKAKVKEAAKA